MRRPLVGVAVAFLAGTAIGLNSSVHMSWLAGAVILWAGALLLAGRRRFSAGPGDVFLLLAVCASAAASAALRTGAAGECRIEPAAGSPLTAVCVADGEKVATRSGRACVRVPMRLTEQTPTDPAAPPGTEFDLLLFGSSEKPVPLRGETWRIHRARAGRETAGGKQTLTAFADSAWRVSRAGRDIVGLCHAARRAAARRLAVGIEDEPETVAVIRALMLGYRAGMDREIADLFALTGTLHIFAISGLHVAILAGLLTTAMSALRVSRPLWGIFLAPLLAAYVVSTGASPSALRALAMACIYWAAPLAHRKPDGASALAAAAVIIPAAAPAQVADPGFILSFTAVLGMIALYPALDRSLPGRLEPDPLAPAGPPSHADRWRAALRQLRDLAILSLAAWLVSVPLIAWYFGRVSFAGLPANLFVVPGSFLVLVGGCMSLLAGLAHDWFAAVFNSANLGLVGGMVGIVRWFASLPGAWTEVARPSPTWIAAWYLLLAGWCFASPAKKRGQSAGTVGVFPTPEGNA